jgi:hypothetical protein
MTRMRDTFREAYHVTLGLLHQATTERERIETRYHELLEETRRLRRETRAEERAA